MRIKNSTSVDNNIISKKCVLNNTQPNRSVKLGNAGIEENIHPVFSFEDFHLDSICIENEFNNFYKDKETYIRIITTLFGNGLKLLAGEDINDLKASKSKKRSMHFHQIKGKEDILIKILEKYHYSKNKLDNIIEGENLYQLEIPGENGSTRVIMHVVDNIFSLLFIDTNHHIYFNKDKVANAGSLFYEDCPVFKNGQCERMEYLNTCFAFDFLDKDKYLESYSNKYNPDIKN